MIASVGPLLVPSRSKNASTSAARLVGQRSAELGQVGQGFRHLFAQRGDELVHHCFGLHPVGFSVGGDHGLVDLPGRFDRGVLLVGEEDAEAFFLAVGQQAHPGVEGAARLVERAVLAVSALVELLLDASSAVIQSVSGQANDVEGIHQRYRAR